MDKIIVEIEGKQHEIKKLTGKDWRVLGEFLEKKHSFKDVTFIEDQAKFIANFFDGVTSDDVLNLPLEEIFPLAISIRDFVMTTVSAKLNTIEKNVVKGEEESR